MKVSDVMNFLDHFFHKHGDADVIVNGSNIGTDSIRVHGAPDELHATATEYVTSEAGKVAKEGPSLGDPSAPVAPAAIEDSKPEAAADVKTGD